MPSMVSTRTESADKVTATTQIVEPPCRWTAAWLACLDDLGQLRRVAVGRENRLFAGSDKGAERDAIWFSVLGTFALAGVDPYTVLRDVLEQFGQNWTPKRVHELLTAAWVARRAAQGQWPAAETPPLPAA